jgi:hypothetical protein
MFTLITLHSINLPGSFKHVQSKSKADKIEGVRKHKELVRAKKMATKERKQFLCLLDTGGRSSKSS